MSVSEAITKAYTNIPTMRTRVEYKISSIEPKSAVTSPYPTVDIVAMAQYNAAVYCWLTTLRDTAVPGH